MSTAGANGGSQATTRTDTGLVGNPIPGAKAAWRPRRRRCHGVMEPMDWFSRRYGMDVHPVLALLHRRGDGVRVRIVSLIPAVSLLASPRLTPAKAEVDRGTLSYTITGTSGDRLRGTLGTNARNQEEGF